ncbi:MAG: hypothetical protein WC356_02785 [Candidatus Micrarchaeia archaeon]|jgi:hypothetical protein
MSDFNDLKQDKSDAYEWMEEGWQPFLSSALYDTERFLGCVDSVDEERARKQGRSYLPMNKIKRQINFISGHEIKNRHILKIGAQGREDDKPCQQHTGIVMQLMSCNGGYDCMSDAFKFGSLVSGSNLMEIWKDRNGDLKFGRRGFNSFLLAPDFKEGDLSDCSSIITGNWLRPSKIKMLLPKDADKIDKIDIKSQSSFRWQYLNPPILKNDDRRLYEEWWQKETKTRQMLISNATGQEEEYNTFIKNRAGGNKQLVERLIAETRLPTGRPAVEKYNKSYDEVTLSIFVDDEPVWTGSNPLGIDEYPFVWLHGDFTPEIDRPELKLQSFARILRESSLLNDRRMNQAMDIIETQIMSGRIFRDKYLKNPEDAYKSGQGVFLHVSDDAPESMPIEQIFQQIKGGDVSASFFNIMEIIEKNEDTIGGLNSDALGQNDDSNMPGILSMFRTGQALTGQQGTFNSFRQAKRQLGVKLVKAIQVNYPPQKIQRLIGEIPAPTFYESDFSKYDCSPVEGVLTETQQNLFYLELKELRERFPDAAQVIPISALIEASPMQFKDRLMQMIKQSEQKTQQAQQLAMAAQQKQDKLIEAQTIATINKSQAEASRSQAELARTEENKVDAELARMKMATEISKTAQQPKLEIMDRLIKLEELQQKQQRLIIDMRKTRNDARNNRSKNLRNRRIK